MDIKNFLRSIHRFREAASEIEIRNWSVEIGVAQQFRSEYNPQWRERKADCIICNLQARERWRQCGAGWIAEVSSEG
jgi:hypothetical protein